jgi:hypothetical protein
MMARAWVEVMLVGGECRGGDMHAGGGDAGRLGCRPQQKMLHSRPPQQLQHAARPWFDDVSSGRCRDCTGWCKQQLAC